MNVADSAVRKLESVRVPSAGEPRRSLGLAATTSIVIGRNIVLAGLAFAFSLWATAGAGRDTLYWGTLLLLAGLPLYVWQQWGQPDGARA